MAALVGLGGSTLAQAPTTVPLISTAGPISISQCILCHTNPADYRSGKLIFKHGAHILLKCEVCHRVFPHQPQGTDRPAMSLCFACHGFAHGPQGRIASGDCKTCHPPGAKTVPVSHTPKWNARLHKDEGPESLRTCQMCHKPSFCEACHGRSGVKAKPTTGRQSQYVFEATVARVTTVGFVQPIPAVASMGGCSLCHGNIDGFKNPGLIFKHGIHLERGIDCYRCHTVFPHAETGTKKPPMVVCYNCHGVRHGPTGEIATTKCAACHPVGFSLMPAAHTAPWRAKDHAKDAKKDLDSCMMCHKKNFCERCHTSKKVTPYDHAKKEWRSTSLHGRKSVDGNCDTCHSSKFCLDCHRTEVPHQVTWLGAHGKVARQPAQACKLCHSRERYCQDCHHGDLSRLKLVQANCVRCHAVYKETKFKQMKSRSAAIHAAHFKMTGTPPYTCQPCHGKSIKSGPQAYAFDILCAECHGKYKRGKLIAKQRVRELCMTCHEEKRMLLPP